MPDLVNMLDIFLTVRKIVFSVSEMKVDPRTQRGFIQGLPYYVDGFTAVTDKDILVLDSDRESWHIEDGLAERFDKLFEPSKSISYLHRDTNSRVLEYLYHNVFKSKHLESVTTEIIDYCKEKYGIGGILTDNVSSNVVNRLMHPSKSIDESSIDFPRGDTLDPTIWGDNGEQYVIREDVQKKIFSVIDEYKGVDLRKEAEEIHIAGSICSNLYRDDVDIDVHIIPKKTMHPDEDLQKDIRDFYTENREALDAKVDTHPVEVYLQLNPYQELMSTGLYNLLNDEWIIPPVIQDEKYDPYNVFKDVMDTVDELASKEDLELGKLKRDVIDFNVIKAAMGHMGKEERKKLLANLKEKLVDIDKEVHQLVKDKKGPEDYKNKKLVGEWQKDNAVFKFLDRYHYTGIIVALEQLINDDDEITEPEVPEVDKIINGESVQDIVDGLLEVIRKKGDKYCVFSRKGRNLGCSDTPSGAQQRLKQVHYFAHKNESWPGYKYIPGEEIPYNAELYDTKDLYDLIYYVDDYLSRPFSLWDVDQFLLHSDVYSDLVYSEQFWDKIEYLYSTRSLSDMSKFKTWWEEEGKKSLENRLIVSRDASTNESNVHYDTKDLDNLIYQINHWIKDHLSQPDPGWDETEYFLQSVNDYGDHLLLPKEFWDEINKIETFQDAPNFVKWWRQVGEQLLSSNLLVSREDLVKEGVDSYVVPSELQTKVAYQGNQEFRGGQSFKIFRIIDKQSPAYGANLSVKNDQDLASEIHKTEEKFGIKETVDSMLEGRVRKTFSSEQNNPFIEALSAYLKEMGAPILPAMDWYGDSIGWRFRWGDQDIDVYQEYDEEAARNGEDPYYYGVMAAGPYGQHYIGGYNKEESKSLADKLSIMLTRSDLVRDDVVTVDLKDNEQWWDSKTDIERRSLLQSLGDDENIDSILLSSKKFYQLTSYVAGLIDHYHAVEIGRN